MSSWFGDCGAHARRLMLHGKCQACEADTLAAEVRRLRALHSPETAEVEDVNGISTVTYCGHDGHPWPCPSIEGRA